MRASRLGRLSILGAFTAGLATLTSAAPARAGDTVLTLDGEVKDTDPRHAFVKFDVPEGIVEIEVRHDDMSDDNILDWGLLDDQGKFRGWGGGNGEPAVVSTDRTSRSYVLGPIAAGSWQVVIGKAKIAKPPATYHLEIHLRDATTLDAQPERGTYAPAKALAKGRRWYAGDLHVHSKESGDAKPSLDEIAALAQKNGLDFVELSDHNTVSQLDFIVDAQARHPKLLFVPGDEWTSYAGHGNGIGATKWVDHKLGIAGVSAQTAADAFAAQGALFSINHPTLDLGDICIGCAWKLDVDPKSVDAVEVINGAADFFTPDSLKFWDALSDKGAHIAAVGGSDDHTAGKDEGALGKPIGTAQTMVLADELSVTALLDGIRAKRTVVRRDPESPMIELGSSVEPDGDTVKGAHTLTLHARITKAKGMNVHFVKNGVAGDDVEAEADPFETELDVTAPEKGEDRYRVEVSDGRPRTITSHLYVEAAKGEPTSSTDTHETSNSSDTDASGGGCGCATPRRAGTGVGAVLFLAAAAALRRGTRRRRASR